MSLKWSFSSDRCFRRCQRQFFFRDIAAWHDTTLGCGLPMTTRRSTARNPMKHMNRASPNGCRLTIEEVP